MEQLKCLEAVSIRMEPSGAVWLIPLILREFSSLSTFGKGARGGGGGGVHIIEYIVFYYTTQVDIAVSIYL